MAVTTQTIKRVIKRNHVYSQSLSWYGTYPFRVLVPWDHQANQLFKFLHIYNTSKTIEHLQIYVLIVYQGPRCQTLHPPPKNLFNPNHLYFLTKIITILHNYYFGLDQISRQFMDLIIQISVAQYQDHLNLGVIRSDICVRITRRKTTVLH